MTSGLKQGRLIGGPKSLQSITVMRGGNRITIKRTTVFERLPCGAQPATATALGTYTRIGLINPPVFIWQGWK
jgi:hypothetical protein